MRVQIEKFVKGLAEEEKKVQNEISNEHEKVANFQAAKLEGEEVVDMIMDETDDQFVSLSGVFHQAIQKSKKQRQMDEIKKNVIETLEFLNVRAGV